MTTRIRKPIAQSIIAVVVLALGSLVAHAGISIAVYKAFKGSILISKVQLPHKYDDDQTTIKAFQKAQLKKLGHEKLDGLATWSFHYLAFMKRNSPVSQLSFDFYVGKNYVASKRISVDTSTKILSGLITMTEDDNLSAGKQYQVKLVAESKGREIVLAETELSLY